MRHPMKRHFSARNTILPRNKHFKLFLFPRFRPGKLFQFDESLIIGNKGKHFMCLWLLPHYDSLHWNSRISTSHGFDSYDSSLKAFLSTSSNGISDPSN